MTAERFDFAILGSGFASSVLAMVLARLEHSIVMIDPASHPRFAIGESSTPAADQILLDLAEDFDLPILAQLARWSTARTIPGVTVGCKRGFSYFFHQRGAVKPQQRCLLVPASPDDPSADSHWLRSEVDALLVDKVRELGVVVYEATEVKQLNRNSDYWQLTAKKNGQQLQLNANFIIDGSGAGEALHKLLESDSENRQLKTNTSCVYSHFRLETDWNSVWQDWGSEHQRFSYSPQYAALHHVVDDGWMWHLGFDDGRVSLGWVLDNNVCGDLPELMVGEGSKESRLAEWWQNRLQQFPALGQVYQNAEMLRPLTWVPRLQRQRVKSAGPGWLALPATVGFVDPLHSTGIAHVMTAIQRIVCNLQSSSPLDDVFLSQYEDGLRKEFWLLDQLISAAAVSRSDSEKWEAATMVYFAGAIAFEEHRNWRRSANRDAAGELPLFLMANDPVWLDCVVRAIGLLSRKKPPAKGWLPAMADILKRHNTAGLCETACQGIYQYTVAKK